MGGLKMNQYAISIKWIDPNGWGIITTFLYKALTEGEAEKKANVAFKKLLVKRYGHYDSEDMEIVNISIEITKSGFFSERSWQVK